MKVTKGDKKNTPKNISKNTPKNAPKVIIVYFVKKFHFRIQFCVYSTFYTVTVLNLYLELSNIYILYSICRTCNIHVHVYTF